MSAILSDFSVTLNQQRWACVLDPTLALSRYGLPLVSRLSEVMELWVVRELWHMLDNTCFYLQQPEALLRYRSPPPKDQPRATIQEILQALREWERIRLETDLTGLKLFWIGDGLSESLLPPEAEPDIVARYESLASSLDRRLNSNETLVSAFRDAAALTATLGSAFILTHLPEGLTVSSPTAICNALNDWEVPCEVVSEHDPWVALERDHLRHLLMQTGLAKLFWAGLRLAVLHLVVPAAATLSGTGIASEALASAEEDLKDFPERQEPRADLWQGAQAFWYPL